MTNLSQALKTALLLLTTLAFIPLGVSLPSDQAEVSIPGQAVGYEPLFPGGYLGTSSGCKTSIAAYTSVGPYVAQVYGDARSTWEDPDGTLESLGVDTIASVEDLRDAVDEVAPGVLKPEDVPVPETLPVTPPPADAVKCAEVDDCGETTWTVEGNYAFNEGSIKFWVQCGELELASCTVYEKNTPCSDVESSSGGAFGCYYDVLTGDPAGYGGRCFDPVDPSRVVEAVPFPIDLESISDS